MSKQREEFEAWFKKTWNGIDLTQTIGDDMAFKLDDKSEYFEDCVQHSWGAWQQAQKMAVPDGFVLVDRNDLITVLCNCSDAMGDESTSSVYDETGEPSTWYDHHVVAETNLMSVIGRAQEQENE